MNTHQQLSGSHDSSVVALISSDFQTVATGFLEGVNVRNMISGNFDKGRIRGESSIDSEAKVYALAALAEHAGLKSHDLGLLVQAGSPRKRFSRMPDAGQRPRETLQYCFAAIMKQGRKASFSSSKLSDIRFIDIPTVLESWKLDAGVPYRITQWKTGWKGGDLNRTNPHHVIGLVKVLIKLRGHLVGATHAHPFMSMLARIEDRGIDIDSYASHILDANRRRHDVLQ